MTARLSAATALLGAVMCGQPALVTIPNKSPIVTFRVVLRAGSALDREGKWGAAELTAAMLTDGGTRDLTYKQILDRMFPMATGVSAQVDKEMIAFSASTHRDNLDAFYNLFRSMLLDPGWRKDDFERLRDDQVNFLRVSLRGNNDEELGKEVLYEDIYKGASYGHVNAGTVSALQNMTIADLQEFYSAHFTQQNLVIGLAGGYPAGFAERVKNDFSAVLKPGVRENAPSPQPQPITGRQLTIVEKQTRSVAYSLGFPLDVKRGQADYPALLVAQTYFGAHRSSGGRLYDRMRQVRGLNYGDYAYIEYFPRGMFLMEPPTNVARQNQLFQIWIRPVEPAAAVFALRLAMFELDRLIQDGLTEEEFTRTRNFVLKFVNLLTKTSGAQLGYKIDSLYYGIPDYGEYLKSALAKLTRGDVNKAIRRHLQSQNLDIVAVTNGAAGLKERLTEPSPITYNSPKAEDVVAEDKIVERYPLALRKVKVVPVDKVFE